MMLGEIDAVKGRLLDLWLDDLRNERRPRICGEMKGLSEAELTEVMELARFYKGALWPTQVTEEGAASLKAGVLAAIAKARENPAAD